MTDPGHSSYLLHYVPSQRPHYVLENLRTCERLGFGAVEALSEFLRAAEANFTDSPQKQGTRGETSA